jgi:hypothetical protein
MNKPKSIHATFEEYIEYRIKHKKTNKILRFWIDVFKSMPHELQEETEQKPTSLVETSNPELNEPEKKCYRFETKDASERLKSYLKNFMVVVEDHKEKSTSTTSFGKVCFFI